MRKNYKRKTGKCLCKNCGIEFEKPMSEIIRNEKLNRPNFCSRKCVGKNNVKNFGDPIYRYDISQHAGCRKDKYTNFRYHYRTIKNRCNAKDIEINITIDDIMDVWDKQNGVCMFTGVELTLSSFSKIKKNPIYSASIDRIDSTKGYLKGNIRWVSKAINWMKNTMSDDMTWELCEIICNNYLKIKSTIN